MPFHVFTVWWQQLFLQHFSVKKECVFCHSCILVLIRKGNALSRRIASWNAPWTHQSRAELVKKIKHDFAVVFVVLNRSRTSHGGCRCKFATTTGWIRTCSAHVVGEPQIIGPLAEWRSLKWLPKKKLYKNWWLGWPVRQCEGRSGKKNICHDVKPWRQGERSDELLEKYRCIITRLRNRGTNTITTMPSDNGIGRAW